MRILYLSVMTRILFGLTWCMKFFLNFHSDIKGKKEFVKKW